MLPPAPDAEPRPIADFAPLLATPEPVLLVGGQAVMEGVMMRAPHSYCVAVRKPSGEIVTEQAPTPVHHLQQSAAGGVVLLMAFEMATELGDAFAQDGHLDLRRTRVLGMNTILLDYRRLLSTYQGHSVYYPF